MNDFDDPIRCSTCGQKMIIYMDTPVCVTCDPLNVAYLNWLSQKVKETKKI